MGRCQNQDFKYHRTNISLSRHSRALIYVPTKKCKMIVLFPLISKLSVLLYKHSVRWVPLVGQVLVILPAFNGFRVIRSFMCMFCGSLFVLLSFFFRPLCRLSFFDLRILVTPLVSFNSSHKRSLNLPLLHRYN